MNYLYTIPKCGPCARSTLIPKAISQAYAPIQERFTECDSRQFVDVQLATEQKPIVFLQTELVNKGCRNRDTPCMGNTLKLHVAAVTDLWKQQVDIPINPHSKPRSANVQVILNAYTMNIYERNQESKADLGDNIHTLLSAIPSHVIQHQLHLPMCVSSQFCRS
ncbi:hypothetical protein LIPSTDRAFT_76665 [Lipomyces starkeyi NRRL Y-11557]|uniref:Uncharacterized protein n=1 Tax=Lipomyces starkeyi NRRL Y-11557 TaxID=675824 RepID=A0A1E3PTZ2_LIPST|nr:hypothetical protein LIPSTDRAFT_76665 [Lipomyces starkeyi NRRL Y-11557]